MPRRVPRHLAPRFMKHQTIPDPTPNPATYTGRWFRGAKQLAEFRAMGALLIHGKKWRFTGAEELTSAVHMQVIHFPNGFLRGPAQSRIVGRIANVLRVCDRSLW